MNAALLTAKETATVTGDTPGGVRVTQHRALNQLRTHIRGELSRGVALRAARPGVGRAAPGPDHVSLPAPA